MKSSVVAASAWMLLLIPAFAACGGSTTTATPTYEAGAPPTTPDDAGTDDAADATDGNAPPVFPDDGTAVRTVCTSTLGKGVTAEHGRLDGQLVAIVTKSQGRCPADDTHVHLQVKMNGAVYDIAVNIDGFEGEVDAPMPGAPYSEGWHPGTLGTLDYVTDLGVHSTSITLTGEDLVRARILEQLTNANHISIFGTGYDDMTGAHLIHYNPQAHDGALVLDPLSSKPHMLVFRFVRDSF